MPTFSPSHYIGQFFCRHSSPLGPLTIASDGQAITGLWFDGQRFFGTTLTGQKQEAQLPVFEEACLWVDTYFNGTEPDFTPPLKLEGTPFRLRVWEQLRTIPYGATTTYGTLARLLSNHPGQSRISAQAVGGAVGHNPIALIIPCHRVVGAHGAMVGYAAGISVKESLLRLEMGN